MRSSSKLLVRQSRARQSRKKDKGIPEGELEKGRVPGFSAEPKRKVKDCLLCCSAARLKEPVDELKG